jgi:MFS family permease
MRNLRPPARTCSTRARILTLTAMSLGYGIVQLDVTIVNTALTSMGASLGGGVSELQWVVSSYTIAFAAFILTAGAAGDRIRSVHGSVAGVCAGDWCGKPHRSTGGSRRGRGDPGAKLPGPP